MVVVDFCSDLDCLGSEMLLRVDLVKGVVVTFVMEV